jgi:hypothetical protein
MSATNAMIENTTANANSGCLRRLVVSSITGLLYCAECGKIMTKLPHTSVCLNRKCNNAGILVEREIKRSNTEGQTRGGSRVV